MSHKYLSALSALTLLVLSACGSSPQASDSQASSPAASDGSGFAYSCQQSLVLAGDDAVEQVFSDAQWEIGPLGFPVPYSSTAGGCQVLDSGVRAGFAHTQQGALLAAITVVAGYNPGATQELFDDFDAKIAPGQGYEKLRAQAQENVQKQPRLLGSDDVKVIGAKVLGFDSEYASFEILIKDSKSPVVYAVTVPLQWVDGDWKHQGSTTSYYYDSRLISGAIGSMVSFPVISPEQVEQ
ncbi:hypothetical protein [Rothia sp. ZJ932]|uniref:hypothetical protein n=1 Tax=Rothia sp. ZJ932 TaxID=2810516 RepID=UPI00196740C9|nr:hypothetical protein [Rothia sp. ZJ932]QRZ61790.1 hypothetical protein JR346_01210 [Rothia sp. ZJ932]